MLFRSEEDHEFASKGDVLIAMRHLDTIAIVDVDEEKVKWMWGMGELEGPHHPTILENKNILVLDNGIYREYSRIIEVNPVTEEIEWEYTTQPPTKFYTPGRGTVQKMPNGNYFICNADSAQLFEINKNKEIIWEYTKPKNSMGKRIIIQRAIKITPQELEKMDIPEYAKQAAKNI